MRFGVLGPLLAWDETGPADLKGPRHRAVLARLLIARGRVVPVDTLIADLWPDPPERAAGAVQTFVGALRKAIEPDRPPRTPPRLLITEGPGYALRPPSDAVDAWRFEALVRAGADLDEALDLWRGPAYADVADQPWARAEIDRLDGLWLLAQHRRAAGWVDSGRAADAVPALESLVKEHPLSEETRRLLALALYRSGRPADALAALREARTTLADELGLDPSPFLRELETDILRHAPAVAAPQPRPSSAAQPLIGRDAELAALTSAAARAGFPAAASPLSPSAGASPFSSSAGASAPSSSAGRGGVVLVGGEPGIGKTALVAAFTRDRPTLWYRNPAELGIPAAGGDPATAETRRRRAVAEHLAGLARVEPLIVVIEDLHAADPATIALIEHLTDPPPAEPILLVATYRTTEAPHALLGRLAHADPVRITLGGLAPDHTRSLVRATLGRDVPDATLDVIQQRSNGNPFFVRELARLVDNGLDGVPPGVRDVVRHRLAQLPAPTQDLIRRASILGLSFTLSHLPAPPLPAPSPEPPPSEVVAQSGVRPPDTALTYHSEVDPPGPPSPVPSPPAPLSPAASSSAASPAASAPAASSFGVVGEGGMRGADTALGYRWAVGGELEAVEEAVAKGFVEEVGPGRFRFAHALVRDTVYDDLSRTRRAAWHLAAADALRDDPFAFAHHLDRAGSPAAADAARGAAELAESRFEPHEAVRWWRTALRHAPGASARTRAEGVMGLARSLAVTGELAEARRRRGEAIALAAGDAALTTRVICAFDVPASWAANDDPELAARIVHAARDALRSPQSDVDRCRLLATIAMEARNTGGPEARAAAGSAVALARGLADPALLGYALNGLYLQTYYRPGLAPERAAIAAELLGLATRHGLVTYQVLGHLLLMQARSALGDFAAADRHATDADALAGEYRIPLVEVFTAGYREMRSAGARSWNGTAGMPGADVRSDRPGAGDAMPGVDLRLDRPATADAMLEARLCHQAGAAIARGDRAAMAALAERLAPAAGERAAGSALIDLGPVADVLDALANAGAVR